MTRIQTIGYVLGRVIAPILIVGLGIGGLLVFGQKPAKQEKPAADIPKAIVEVVSAESFDGIFHIEVDGVAVPLRQVQSSARVAGLITMKSDQCRGGMYVDAGDVLIEIDRTDYELEEERLQVQLEQANENLAEVAVDLENIQHLIELAQEDAKLQQRNLQRKRDLLGRGASTDAAIDEALKLELSSRNALRTLQNQQKTHEQRQKTLAAARKLATTQLKRAESDLTRTTVAAPVSGTIVQADVEQGDYVKVGDPLFRTNDTDDMEVSCQLRVEELYWIWMQAGTFSPGTINPDEAVFEVPPTPVDVVFEFKGIEYLWKGELSRYEGTGLDPSTRTIPCRVLVKEPTDVQIAGGGARGLVSPPTLFSGMYVKVRVPVDPPIPLVAVPNTAVQPGGDIWLVRDGALDIEDVTVARMNGDSALLLPSQNGPQPGESVVVSPMAGPTQGMEVHPINPNSPMERAAAEAAAMPSPESNSDEVTAR